MKTYFIESTHFVYIDNYNEGEQELINCYTQEAMIKAENINKLDYSNLVDDENSEATENDCEKWRQGKKVLYSNNTILSIFEVKPVKI